MPRGRFQTAAACQGHYTSISDSTLKMPQNIETRGRPPLVSICERPDDRFGRDVSGDGDRFSSSLTMSGAAGPWAASRPSSTSYPLITPMGRVRATRRAMRYCAPHPPPRPHPCRHPAPLRPDPACCPHAPECFLSPQVRRAACCLHLSECFGATPHAPGAVAATAKGLLHGSFGAHQDVRAHAHAPRNQHRLTDLPVILRHLGQPGTKGPRGPLRWTHTSRSSPLILCRSTLAIL